MCTCQDPDGSAVVSSVMADPDEPAPAADSNLLDDLVAANRILFDQGVVDAFGHVSVRHDKRPDRYLLARNMAPAQVTRDDIIEFDLESTPVSGAGRAMYLERFIHGEIYRARPDVMAVVHSHSPTVVPFSIVPSVTLRPVCHMSGFLGEGAPNFEIRDVAGTATDLLIRSRELGAALAQSLGSGLIVLMRGHGSTVVGESLQHAVYRAVYTEINARLQAEAMRLGPVIYLTPEEAATSLKNVETQIRRPWDLWKMRVRQVGALGSRKASSVTLPACPSQGTASSLSWADVSRYRGLLHCSQSPWRQSASPGEEQLEQTNPNQRTLSVGQVSQECPSIFWRIDVPGQLCPECLAGARACHGSAHQHLRNGPEVMR